MKKFCLLLITFLFSTLAISQVNSEYKYPKEYLFRDHSKELMYKWLTSLNYFVLNRAVGGTANDGDYFSLQLNFGTAENAKAFLDSIGVEKITETDQTRISFSKPYNPFKTHYYKDKYELHIFTAGLQDPYKMGDAELELCLLLEKFLKQNHFDRFVDPSLKKSPSVVTLEKYSDYFK